MERERDEKEAAWVLTGAAALATKEMCRLKLPLGWAAGTAALKADGLLASSRAALGRLVCICSSDRFFMVEKSLEVENEVAGVDVPAQQHCRWVNWCGR